MFSFLKTGVDVIVQAAQDVADELQNQPGSGHTRTARPIHPADEEGDLVRLGPNGRVILCGFPDKALSGEAYREDRSLKPFGSPPALKRALYEKFPNGEINYLVWNLSGQKYAYDELDGKLIEYDFPSRPILPFDVLLEVVNAIKSWILESPKNVALVHDISGRRAAVVVACVLDSLEYYPRRKALRSVASEMGRVGDALVASQVRYYEYYCDFLDQKTTVDLTKQLRLERIIVNGIPDFTYEAKLSANVKEATCKPLVKIIDGKNNELDSTVPPEHPVSREEASFNIHPTYSLILERDILIKFLHRKEDGKEHAMFAINLHIAFVNDVVMRFSANDIDGTYKNPRFVKDMFVDMIFSDPASKHLESIEVLRAESAQRDNPEVTLHSDTIGRDDGSLVDAPDISVSELTSTAEADTGLIVTKADAKTARALLSPTDSAKEDNVLKEIEAALGEEDFAMEDFELSDLNDLKTED